MSTLEDYLNGDYRGDIQEIEALSRALEQAAHTFKATFEKDGEYWPYQYKTDGNAQGKKSQGTLAMVLCATGKLLGNCDTHGRIDIIKDKALNNDWNAGLKALIADISPAPIKEKAQAKSDCSAGQQETENAGGFGSSTFGPDNAMTLSHVAELGSAFNGEQKEFAEKVAPKLCAAVKKLADAISTSIDQPLLFPKPEIGTYRPSGFILLRLLRACRDVGQNGPEVQLRRYFESGLHDQLSFSAIPDSRFDPAELLFCLEGFLICAPEAVDGVLFERILAVLAEKQNTSAHWRPNKPFLSSDRGTIMLPLSIECANSLMRSIAIIDEYRMHDLFGSKALPLLHRFWSWLEARSVKFTPEKGPSKDQRCVGWHSEHVNEPDLIHIWDTSQVVEFMVAYRALLFKHVARKTLDLSGVKERRPKSLKESLPAKRENGGEKIESYTYTWADVEEDREPLEGVSRPQIFADVGKYFVAPHAKQSKGKRNYSMLLYGPPGTGKSSLAELMADALGWPMLTVTVSDFLGSGGAMVEARAKAIFQMLEAQSEMIILFDEIDAFLLNRDSKFYRDQETLFQFLTPGMLTKINDLRKAKRSIFIIATNYANRIDPAIKRIGRIDHKFLLLPPNLERRRSMIRKAWSEENAKRKEAKQEMISLPMDTALEMAAKASYYLGWNDIDGAVKEAMSDPTVSLIQKLEESERSTGAGFYGRRFPVEMPFEGQVFDETLWLYRFAEEVERALDFSSEFAESAAAATYGDDAAAKQMKNKATKFVKTIAASKPE